ncbi:MAG: hypothetical protein JWN86_4200 [Planctomycetota bacterium]|nr:hypothetical protein [Planctomycetota bacterium]
MTPPEGDFPPYAFVPGGPYPHPTGSPDGHLARAEHRKPHPIQDGNWRSSESYLRGIALFNAGYYWEAHEEWEGLWHAHGRRGPIADVLKGLIKLAAAGVKVRQRQRHGVVTHAGRAAEAFQAARQTGSECLLGFDLLVLILTALDVVAKPPDYLGSPADRVVCVFEFDLQPQ